MMATRGSLDYIPVTRRGRERKLKRLWTRYMYLLDAMDRQSTAYAEEMGRLLPAIERLAVEVGGLRWR